MGHTRQKDRNDPTKFEYTLFCEWEEIETVGGFATAQEADQAAQRAERTVFAVRYNVEAYLALYAPTEFSDLSDDELLQELLA